LYEDSLYENRDFESDSLYEDNLISFVQSDLEVRQTSKKDIRKGDKCDASGALSFQGNICLIVFVG